MVIWLIGMSASGKTTIGEKLINRLKSSGDKWLFVDGDTFRHILGEDLGHSLIDRKKNAYRISRFCEYLSNQGVNVVACVLSIFHDNQKYNKENIADYKEVFIDVSFENLLKRDNKDLYKKALSGEIKDVVGVDIDFFPPYSPDLTIDNNGELNTDLIIDNIIRTFSIEIDEVYKYTKLNLLENPEKYEYSAYEGNKFFKKYLLDRENAIIFLEARLAKVNKVNKVNKVENKNVDFIRGGNIFITDLLCQLIATEGKYILEYKEIIIVLIKRFEVSKKLYETYCSKEVRKSTTDTACLNNYALFSIVLQKFIKHTSEEPERLMYLNSVLKLNDILSSVKSHLISDEEIKNTILAIEGELQFSRSYYE